MTAPSPPAGPGVAGSDANRAALDAALPGLYDALRVQAARALRREAPGHTLQTTELVHEAYLRLVGQQRVRWDNRAQALGVATACIRRVLVDHARARAAAKRGGGARPVTLGTPAAPAAPAAVADDFAVEVLALDDALARLAALDPQQARVVELRYFGGLEIDETAAALGVSPSTVKRQWAVARAWLRRELAP